LANTRVEFIRTDILHLFVFTFTGRSLNRVKNVEQDLKSVQAQLDRMEERRKSDQKILEEQTAKTNAAIEDALKNLTGQL